MKKSAAMNAKLIRVFFAAMLVLSLAACSYDTAADMGENYYTFTDHCGNEIVLSQQPQKVAVLFSSFADIWVTAGGSVDVTVGESVERGFAPSDVILVDSGAGKSIDTELLIASKPDFVICSADVPAQQNGSCSEKGKITEKLSLETMTAFYFLRRVKTPASELYMRIRYGLTLLREYDTITGRIWRDSPISQITI
jgi:iron complex transport system substrate-binding protein